MAEFSGQRADITTRLLGNLYPFSRGAQRSDCPAQLPKCSHGL